MTGGPRLIERCFRSRIRVQTGVVTAAPEGTDSSTNGGAAIAWETGDLREGLGDSAGEAMAGLLPAMVCGEESAVMVFANEARRVPEGLLTDSRAVLARIAGEEEGHEHVLRGLASMLPEAGHEARVRRAARRFFAGLHTENIGEHFSRIGWLDSGVCIILSRVCASPKLRAAAPLRGAFLRIVREEAGHVAFSRRYAEHLGVKMLEDRESFLRVRGGLVAVLEPCGGALEDLGVDPGELFGALRGRAFAGEQP